MIHWSNIREDITHRGEKITLNASLVVAYKTAS
jgi:hypothetical protein